MTNELNGDGNELSTDMSLSDDINTITAEINAYQRVAGEAIFEIGRRLKHVKENDLAHGEWTRWLESIRMDRASAHKFIYVYEEMGDKNVETFQRLGMTALYEIATLPTAERNQTHTTSKGEEKKPEDMTVKELREVKRQLKQEKEAKEEAEARADQYRKSSEIERKKREEAEEREPEVRIEYIEKESEEPYDRRYDRPYDVERTNDFYVMMNEVDSLYKKYAHLRDSIGEMKTIAKYDSDLCKRYEQASDLWEMLGEIFNDDNDIIDAEII